MMEGMAVAAEGVVKYTRPVGNVKDKTPAISQCRACFIFLFFCIDARFTEITKVQSNSPK